MRNVVEDVVAMSYSELLPTVPNACGCAICREDVLVFALNRLHPLYVSTLKGEVLSKLEMGADQGRADVAVAILEGIRNVRAAPRCGRAPVLD
jgi:competence protein ComFB